MLYIGEINIKPCVKQLINITNTQKIYYFVILKNAKKLCQKLYENGIKYKYIDSETSKEDRIKYIEYLETGKICCLVSIKCLIMGINILSANCCMFVDDSNSGIDIIQKIGRVLRKYKDKEKAFICIFSEQYDEDYVLDFYMKMKDFDKSVKTKCNIEISGFENITNEEISELEEYLEKFETNIFSRQNITEIWEKRLTELKNYVQEYNKIPKYSEKIGNWFRPKILYQEKYFRRMEN